MRRELPALCWCWFWRKRLLFVGKHLNWNKNAWYLAGPVNAELRMINRYEVMLLQDGLLAIIDPWLDRIALCYCGSKWVLCFKKPLRGDCNLLFGAAGSVAQLRCTSFNNFFVKSYQS
jgi:hypothetical protein